jgi:aspartate kinase
MRPDPELPARVVACLDRAGVPIVLASGSAVGVSVAVPASAPVARAAAGLEHHRLADVRSGFALVCIVGVGIGQDPALRGRALDELARCGPELVVLGASGTSVAAVLEDARLEDAVREIHAAFFAGAREARA